MTLPLRVDPTDGLEGLCLGDLGPWLRLSPPALRLAGRPGWAEPEGDGFPESGVDGLVVRHRIPGGLELRRHWRHRGLPPGAVACFVEAFQGGEAPAEVVAWRPWRAQGTPPLGEGLGLPEALGEGLWRLRVGPQAIAIGWLGQAGGAPWSGWEGGWEGLWAPPEPQRLGPGALAWAPTLFLWPLAEGASPEATWRELSAQAPSLGLA